MRILWVTTKPPWPAVDGGRALMVHTLRALASEGHRPVLVTPFDPAAADREQLTSQLREFCDPHLVAASPGSWGRSLMRSLVGGRPLTIIRHALPAVGREVSRLLDGHRFHVVHAEQVQALANCASARRLSVPIVLRVQNVESDLWSGLKTSWPVASRLIRREAERLAAYEGRAVCDVATTVALTARDAERLGALAGGRGVIRHLPAPYPDRLPPGDLKLDGDPPVVVLATGWFPNREGAAWFAESVWPMVLNLSPGAVLHLFGTLPSLRAARTIVVHPTLEDSGAAFPPGAILAVPLRIASGVRIRILEAWARGVPIVATPIAAAGLEASPGKELLIAADPQEFARAIDRYHHDPSFAGAVVESGRALLKARHAPRQIGSALAEIYTGVAHPARR